MQEMSDGRPASPSVGVRLGDIPGGLEVLRALDEMTPAHPAKVYRPSRSFEEIGEAMGRWTVAGANSVEFPHLLRQLEQADFLEVVKVPDEPKSYRLTQRSERVLFDEHLLEMKVHVEKLDERLTAVQADAAATQLELTTRLQMAESDRDYMNGVLNAQDTLAEYKRRRRRQRRSKGMVPDHPLVRAMMGRAGLDDRG